MERTVPQVASEEIELYLRTYYSLLRSSAEVRIRTLEEVHAGMNSLLHSDARSQVPDISAFIYCILRLPEVMPQTRVVVLGQSSDIFKRPGYFIFLYGVHVNCNYLRQVVFIFTEFNQLVTEQGRSQMSRLYGKLLTTIW